MIQDDATEKLKKKAAELGLIVNASADQPKPKGSQKKKDKKK